MNSGKIKKSQKLVTFNDTVIYFFIDFEEDRKGYWVENRYHFQRHCHQIENAISFVFNDSHRLKIRNLIKHWQSLDPELLPATF